MEKDKEVEKRGFHRTKTFGFIITGQVRGDLS